MKQITDINQVNDVLADYNGSIADLALFSISLKRLAIRITKADTTDVLHLVVVGCLHITGPFSWKNALMEVSFSDEVDAPFGGYIITDKKAGFKLTTVGGLVILKGRLEEFGDSLDHFVIGDVDE